MIKNILTICITIFILLVAAFAAAPNTLAQWVFFTPPPYIDLQTWCQDQGQAWNAGGKVCTVRSKAEVSVSGPLPLLVAAGEYLVNHGTINNFGTIENDGFIFNHAHIDNLGSIQNAGFIFNLCGGVLTGHPVFGGGVLDSLDNCVYLPATLRS